MRGPLRRNSLGLSLGYRLLRWHERQANGRWHAVGLGDLRERSGRGVYAKDHDGIGVLVFGEQKAPRGINGKVARFFASRGEFTGWPKHPAGGIDRENSDSVVATVGGEQPFAVWMHGDFGVVIPALEILWERGDNLEILEYSFPRIIGKRGDRGVQFADNVEELAVR